MFMTMTPAGGPTTGEPISSSATITVQWAVPPRISGPYDGIQVTCLPFSSAVNANSVPANSAPCPPNPEMISSVCMPSSFVGRHIVPASSRDRGVDLVVSQREGRQHVVLDPIQRFLGRQTPIRRAARQQLDHREPEPLLLDFEGGAYGFLRPADVGDVVQAAAG